MNSYKEIKKASILGIIGNLFLMIIKGIIAIYTHSQAMLADATNSAGDILSSIMTYVGNKIASKPSDDDHNLGHGKAEYIYSMFISIIMIITSTILFKDSLFCIFNQKTYEYSNWLIIICIASILTKLALYLYTNNLSKKYHNLLIKANSKDHLNDSIITTINLISCILSSYNIYIFDGVVGIIISLWILYTSLKIFIESYHILMDKSMSLETKEQVYKIILKNPNIKKIQHFNSTPVGYKYQISFTIYVDGSMSTFKSHEIANNLEKEIIKKIENIYLVVVHVNPIKIIKEKNYGNNKKEKRTNEEKRN